MPDMLKSLSGRASCLQPDATIVYTNINKRSLPWYGSKELKAVLHHISPSKNLEKPRGFSSPSHCSQNILTSPLNRKLNLPLAFLGWRVNLQNIQSYSVPTTIKFREC